METHRAVRLIPPDRFENMATAGGSTHMLDVPGVDGFDPSTNRLIRGTGESSSRFNRKFRSEGTSSVRRGTFFGTFSPSLPKLKIYDENTNPPTASEITGLKTAFKELEKVFAPVPAVLSLVVHMGVFFTGSHDGKIRSYRIHNGEQCADPLEGHTGAVTSLCILPGNIGAAGNIPRLASASLDGTVRVWNLGSASCEHVMKGHPEGVTAVAVRDKFVASGDRAGSIRVWNSETGKCVVQCHHQSATISCLDFAADDLLMSSSWDRSVIAISIPTGTVDHVYEGFAHSVNVVRKHESLVICGDASGFLRYYDFQSETCLLTVRCGKAEPVSALDIASDGERTLIVAGTEGGNIFQYEPEREVCEHVYTGHKDTVTQVHVVDGILYSGSFDQTIRSHSLVAVSQYILACQAHAKHEEEQKKLEAERAKREKKAKKKKGGKKVKKPAPKRGKKK